MNRNLSKMPGCPQSGLRQQAIHDHHPLNGQTPLSVTTARKYIDYLLASKPELVLPVVPSRCVICYATTAIEALMASSPHTAISVGVNNPVQLYFFYPEGSSAFAVAKGMHGAPMAAVLLEELIALGFEEFLVIGPAGHPSNSLTPKIHVGDLLLVTQAFIFEGTSGHYGQQESIKTAVGVSDQIRRCLRTLGITHHEGAVATTDALYRETADFIDLVIHKQALALDMEMSALSTVADFHGKQIAGLLFISDIVRADGTWELGLTGAGVENLSSDLAELVREFTSP